MSIQNASHSGQLPWGGIRATLRAKSMSIRNVSHSGQLPWGGVRATLPIRKAVFS
jgi:hypothetical protein